MTPYIVVSGREVPVYGATDVRLWHETGMTFSGLGRRTQTRAVTLHWTAGEGSAPTVFHVLREKGFSVPFVVDREGIVWQFCDASDRAAHVGRGNGFSVGIEIVNRANGKPFLTPGGKHPREVYPERVHGHTFRCTAFYPAQVAAAKGLTQALCLAYGLPYQTHPSDTVLDVKTLGAFRGVLGHFHYTRLKTDPGTRLLREMGLR